MYIYFRALKLALTAKQEKNIDVWDEIQTPMIVWPTDIDVFFEVNNGRYLTLMDIGRFELGIKSGLLKALKRRKWQLAVAGSSVRYRKRMHLFQRFVIHSRMVAVDERWTYIQQIIKRDGEWCVAALFRTAVTDKNGIVPTAEVAAELGRPYEQRIPEWVTKWAESDEMRPWGDSDKI